MPEFPPLPESISGTVLESRLREGPGTVVMRGRDTLGLAVDVHLHPAALVLARVPKEVFFDEVRATAALHHERLATVVNAGEKGPWLFVVCKGTEGATLAHLFGRGHLDEERALGIFAAACEGLAALEKAGLRHGGLDPRVVLLPGAGQVLLGLRRLVPLDLAARDACYLSPEEAKGQDWGIASDLYSLGLMLYEAFLGRPVLEGSPEEVKVRIARGDVPHPSRTLKGFLPQSVDFLASLLAQDPRARPPSAAETVSRLRALQSAFSMTESLEGSLDAPLSAIPLAAAPAPARAAPPPPSPPPPPALRGRRAHARLVLPFGGQDQLHELLETVTWIGPTPEGRIAARPEEFAGAVARVELGSTSDFLVATGAAPRPLVGGRDAQRHELRFGDTISIGGRGVVFEKAERLVPEGEVETEQEHRHRARPERPWRVPIAVGSVLCGAAVVWGVLRWQAGVAQRFPDLEEARGRLSKVEAKFSRMPAEPAAATQQRAGRESAALRLLEAARDDRRAGRSREALERLETILRVHGDTGAALLAREEVKDLRGALPLPGAEDLRAAQAAADGLAAEGKFADAQALLLKFSAEHPATFAGDRAARSAEALALVAADRVDELLRQARLAADRRDWPAALGAADRAVNSAAGADARARAEKERDRIRGLMPRTAPDGKAGPGPAASEAGAPKPPTPKTPAPKPAEPKSGELRGKDLEASELFRASRTALEQGRIGEAERGFYRLLSEYADAKIVREYGQEVAQRYLDAVKRGRGVAGLFRAPVQIRGSRVTLKWTFQEPEQAEDWEAVNMFAVPAKGNFRIQDGELAADGAGAFMLRACFRPESVTMSFRIKPGVPPQDMGAVMAEPKDLTNHLLFILGNDYFKLDKGPKAYAAPGNMIVVFGKGMWARGDADQLGFVRTGSSEEPKLRSREWADIEVSKDRDKAKFVVQGKVIPGRSIGDNKYEITGVRPALYVLLSEARFDEVAVEGELDPAWALAERARLFPEPK